MNAVAARSRLLDAPALDAAGQMALDEALLDCAGAGESILRFYRWQGPAVTFGYFQAHAEARALAQARGMGAAPLVRRLTGGGAVFHDGDLTFSWVFSWPDASAPQLIYKDLHRAVHLGFKSLGLATRLWSPPSGPCPPAAACFTAPAPIDLVTEDGRKILGGALRKRRGLGLYQGSLRAEGRGRSVRDLKEAVARGLFDGEPALRSEAEPELLGRAQRLARERYCTPQWNEKR